MTPLKRFCATGGWLKLGSCFRQYLGPVASEAPRFDARWGLLLNPWRQGRIYFLERPFLRWNPPGWASVADHSSGNSGKARMRAGAPTSHRPGCGIMTLMRRKGLKFLVLLALAWRLGWPLVETVDSWDDLQAVVHDIAASSWDVLTVALALVSYGFSRFKELRDRCSHLARTFARHLFFLSFAPAIFPIAITPVPSVSPPSPLRI